LSNMQAKLIYLCCVFILFSISCESTDTSIPTTGFVDAFEDATIAHARQGFVDALASKGLSEAHKTINILHRNPQGDVPTLTQIVNYYISEKVNLVATNTTLSTVTAVQRVKDIPIFMMVSPEPKRMNIVNLEKQAPSNLYGVSESLAYIDTSFAMIPKFIKP